MRPEALMDIRNTLAQEHFGTRLSSPPAVSVLAAGMPGNEVLTRKTMKYQAKSKIWLKISAFFRHFRGLRSRKTVGRRFVPGRNMIQDDIKQIPDFCFLNRKFRCGDLMI